MSLPSHQLDAFLAVARNRNFSTAAKSLHVTQSALSQRILNLEGEIGSTLFIREPGGVRPTENGEKLLRYCQLKENLESELLGEIHSPSARATRLRGVARIAGFSTIGRSIVLPIVARLMEEHPEVRLEYRDAELRELPTLLASGAVDFVFGTGTPERQGVECHALGFERNVLIESLPNRPRTRSRKRASAKPATYLDHDAADTTTQDFFRAQGTVPIPAFTRNYLGDIYAILDAVALRLGRAVVPLHLARATPHIAIVKGYRPLDVPVNLQYYAQAYYTDLQRTLRDRFLAEVPRALAP